MATLDLGKVVGTDGKSATLDITGAQSLPYGSQPTVTEVSGSTSLARKYVLGIPEGKPGTSTSEGGGAQIDDYVPSPTTTYSSEKIEHELTKLNEANEEQDEAIAKKLNASELSTAINTALAQAKASGEFDGKDGEPGAPGYTPQKGVDYFDGAPGAKGDPGYTPQKGVDYFDGAPGAKGDPGYTPQKGVDYFDGSPGKDGKTPVRGTDYWTATDIAEIKSYVDDAILGGTW